MTCVIQMLVIQHSKMFEAARNLARISDHDTEIWPGELYAFRQTLVQHDRMERDVFRRLGIPAVSDDLIHLFDSILDSRPDLDAPAVGLAARRIIRALEDHAQVQEAEVFPDLLERHPLLLRRQLGERYTERALGAHMFGGVGREQPTVLGTGG